MNAMRKPSKAALASQALDDANIARAVAYSAFLHISPKDRHVIQTNTLAEAQAEAIKLLALPNRYGRIPMVYAITPEGWSIPMRPEDQAAVRQIQSRQ